MKLFQKERRFGGKARGNIRLKWKIPEEDWVKLNIDGVQRGTQVKQVVEGL